MDDARQQIISFVNYAAGYRKSCPHIHTQTEQNQQEVQQIQ
jgi:hypothetical protein